MTGLHQRAEMLDEQGAQQGGDMQAVGVGVGEDADLAVAQLGQIGGARIDADGHGDVMYFLAGEHLAAVDLPGVQDLATQRHDRLKLLVPRLLGGAAGRVAFHQEQLGAHRVLPGAVGQLARQRRPLSDLLALDLLAGLQSTPGIADCQLCQLHAQLRVGIEPEAEGILDHTRDERRRLA